MLEKLKRIIIIKAVLILFYVFGVVLTGYFQKQYANESLIWTTQSSMRGVQSALEIYWHQHHCYPKSLAKLLKEGYLETNANKDFWNNDYYYLSSNNNRYILISAGPDGKINTKDDIAPPVNALGHVPENFTGKTSKVDFIGDKNRSLTIVAYLLLAFIIIPFMVVYDIGFLIRNRKSKIKGFSRWNTISICFTVGLIFTILMTLIGMISLYVIY